MHGDKTDNFYDRRRRHSYSDDDDDGDNVDVYRESCMVIRRIIFTIAVDAIAIVMTMMTVIMLMSTVSRAW